MAAFDDAFEWIVSTDAGFAHSPGGQGTDTKFGINSQTAKAAGYSGRISRLTRQQAKSIYRKEYWDRLSLDEVYEWSPELTRKLFDIAVNLGPRTAGFFLQRALNLLNHDQRHFSDLVVDGLIGTSTLETLHGLDPGRDGALMCKIVETYQCRRYLEIVENDPSLESSLRGWISRLIAGDEGTASSFWQQVSRSSLNVDRQQTGPAESSEYLGEKLLGKPNAHASELKAMLGELSESERRSLVSDDRSRLELARIGLYRERVQLERAHLQLHGHGMTPKVLAYVFSAALMALIGVQILLGIYNIRLNEPASRMLDASTGALLAVVAAFTAYFFAPGKS